MGSVDNRLRKKWQDYSGKNAGNAEKDFYETFIIIFKGTDLQIREKPKEFINPANKYIKMIWFVI
jgi:hypothetical protein